MNGISIISAEESLIEAILPQLTPAGKDYSDGLVVFPGKRPAHFLRQALAKRVGSSYLPPHIVSMDRFIETLFFKHLQRSSRLLDPLDAVAILFEIHQQLEQPLGEQAFVTLDAFLSVGRKLFSEIEEIALANLPDQKVGEILRDAGYPKYWSFFTYYTEFHRTLTERGLTTRASMYRTVAEHAAELDLRGYTKVIIAGFYGLTQVERAIFRVVREQENILFIFQDGVGLKEQLVQASLLREDEYPFFDQEQNALEVRFIKAPDAHGQAFALSALLKERVDRGDQPDERSVVVLPSGESLFPVLRFPLSLLEEEQYNIALGYSVERTPVYGFLCNLMDLLRTGVGGKYSTRAYLNFVLHPYVKNIRFGNRTDVTRILFQGIEEFCSEQPLRTHIVPDALAHDETLLSRIHQRVLSLDPSISVESLQEHLETIHQQTFTHLLSPSSIEDLARRCRDILACIEERSTANLHPMFEPYVEAILDALKRLETSLLAKKTFADLTGYFGFLQSYLAGESVPFPGTPLRGLQVLGLLETRNLKFESVYFLDATDDIIPGTTGYDTLLPQMIRAKLGLETSLQRERLLEYYFHLVVQGAKEISIFYAEAGKKEKSRFVQKLLWEKQKHDRSASIKGYEEIVKYRLHLATEKPDGIKKTKATAEFARSMRFSASVLDCYLHCQVRFYHRYILGLREKATLVEDLDSAEVGTIIHHILREYFQPFIGKILSLPMLDEGTLREISMKSLREKYGLEQNGLLQILEQRISQQLERFLALYMKPLVGADRVMITDLEKTFVVEKNGFQFQGKIDRVELRNDLPVIIDYKTGSDESRVQIRPEKIDRLDRSTWIKGIGSFQLPLYMLLYASSTGRDIQTIQPYYLFLGRNIIDRDIEVSLGKEKPAHAIYCQIEPVIFDLIGEITSETDSFEPTKEIEKECPSCPFTTICGTDWVRSHVPNS